MNRKVFLVQLLVVISVLNCVPSTQAEEDPALPERLQILNEGYERAKERALKPIEDQYDLQLKELLLVFTKAGRLEDAMAVNKIIASRAPAPDSKEHPGPTHAGAGDPAENSISGPMGARCTQDGIAQALGRR